MKNKHTIEEEINSFLEIWDCNQICDFLRDIIPIFELYYLDDDNDWVMEEIGGDEEETRTIRLIRTVYLISKIAENHAGRLANTKIKFKNLFIKMEKMNIGQ